MAKRFSDLQSSAPILLHFVQRKYGRAIVVFDGTTKCQLKLRRSRGAHQGRLLPHDVIFTESISVTLKKDNFLSNPKNKQRFLSMLSKASVKLSRMKDV